MNKSRIYGAIYSREQTQFRLWAPRAAAVELRLFPAGSESEDPRGADTFAMVQDWEGTWTVTIDGDLAGVYYEYILMDDEERRTVSADPWAKACGVNGRRSMVVDLRATDPEGWENDSRIAGSGTVPVIWETHVRDFSIDPSSGVRPEWRGKYLAFTEEDSTVDGDGVHPTCVSYLKKLGVTHVQLQPIADYCTVEESTCENYNWGYDIDNYNIPEGGFSTDPFHGEVRIRECKAMIQALHKAGIGVILDVVYNHTYKKDSWLARTAPGEYYRHAQDGSYLNASGCGNETATEREPFRNYMLQSLLYWVEEYHVDGFRFDLMGIHDTDTMNIIRGAMDSLPNGRDILLYGEPWYALPTGMHAPSYPATKENLSRISSRIAAFSDGTRDAIAGEVGNADNGGYAVGLIHYWTVNNIKSAVCGWCRHELNHYAQAPSQVIQYVSCHDNFALWDRFVRELGVNGFETESTAIERSVRFASGIYMTCLGYAFLQSGEEFGRTKLGNGNTYNGPEAVNALKWRLTVTRAGLVEWYRGLIGLRRQLLWDLGIELSTKVQFRAAPDNAVAFTLPGRDGRDYFIGYNPMGETLELGLPEGEWELLCSGDDSTLWENGAHAVAGSCAVSPLSIVICGKRN